VEGFAGEIEVGQRHRRGGRRSRAGSRGSWQGLRTGYASATFSCNPAFLATHSLRRILNASLVSEAADRHGVPKPLALAVAFHESRLDRCARSHTGVKGVMQVTGMTARTYRLDRDLNEHNVEAGVRVLRAAIRTCDARDYGCLAARYNGSTKVERAK
jgi:soluble lytic murein transglycosylase-like protein